MAENLWWTTPPRVSRLAWIGVLVLLSIRPGAAAPVAVADHDYTVDVWQVEDGLPQNSVTSIVQTPDGYLWLATFNGLVRFDGVRFTVFDEGNTPALQSSRLVRLDAHQDGDLWIITEGGALTRFREGRFRSFAARDGLPPAGASAVVRGPQGRLLLLDREGGVYQLADDKWISDQRWGFLRGNRVSLFTDEQENLWVWFRQKRSLGRIVADQLVLLKRPDGVQEAEVRAYARSRNGGLWLVISDKVWHYHCQRQEWKPTAWVVPDSAHGLTHMLEDHRGNIWLGTYGDGLLRFGTSGIVERFATGKGLSHNAVRALREDREGSLWVGTDGGGLNRLKPQLVATYDVHQGLTAHVVMSIAQDPRDANVLWLGLNGGGVNRLRMGSITPLIVEPVLNTNTFVYGILADRQSGLWIGTYDLGILRYHEGGLTRMVSGTEWEGRPLLTGLEDRSGTIWLGGGFGLLRWQDGQFTNLNAQLGWSNVVVRALAEDRAGNIYVGSFGNGLSRWSGGRWAHYSENDGLADNHLSALYSDGNDTLWIGTYNGGLSRFNNGQFTTYTMREGLPANYIASIVEDDSGNLWMGSNRGLFRVAKGQLNEFAAGRRRSVMGYTYGLTDGLNTLECGGGAHPAACKARDGTLMFATVRGLAVVDPGKLSSNPLPPPVVLEEVLVDGQGCDLSGAASQAAVAAHSLPDEPRGTSSQFIYTASQSPSRARPAPSLIVPPQRDRVEFRFTGLSFLAPGKVRFRYRLEGYDRDWIDAGPQRVAYYTHLPPGRYRFQVTACNNDGVWNHTGAELLVTVLPRFWQTVWFTALVAIGLIAGTAGLVYRVSTGRMQRRLERLEQQQALERERSRIAQDIHDDLGARLTQIGLLGELAARDANSPEQLRSGIGNIATLTRGMAQAMDEIVWAVDPTKDTLEGLLNYLAPLTQELLELTPIRCRLDIPVVLPPWPVSARARHNLLLVAMEALNNCIKHSGASEVWVRAALHESVLSLEVEDNGRGFQPIDAVRAGRGNGLANMRKRVEELGGQFTLASRPGQGTKIGMRVDLSRNA